MAYMAWIRHGLWMALVSCGIPKHGWEPSPPRISYRWRCIFVAGKILDPDGGPFVVPHFFWGFPFRHGGTTLVIASISRWGFLFHKNKPYF